MFFPFIQTKSFQYEREVRIISDVSDNNTLNDDLKNVNIDQLIEKYTSIQNQKTGIKPCHQFSKTTWI
jgi:hypothetical protein